MSRPKTISTPGFTLRLTDPQEVLLGEVQVAADINDKAPAVRRIFDAVIQSIDTGTPISVLLPINVAPVLKALGRKPKPIATPPVVVL